MQGSEGRGEELEPARMRGARPPLARDAAGGSGGATLAAGRAWLGTRAAPSPALGASTRRKKTLRMICGVGLPGFFLGGWLCWFLQKIKSRGVDSGTVAVVVTTCSFRTRLCHSRIGSCLATGHLVAHRGSPSSHDGGSSCQNCHLLPPPRSSPVARSSLAPHQAGAYVLAHLPSVFWPAVPSARLCPFVPRFHLR